MSARELLAGEEWRPVPGWEGYYEASNLGRVYSVKRPNTSRSGRVLAATPTAAGHLSVSLRRNPDRKEVRVHQVILWAFVGPCPPGMEVRHLDGDPTNNRLENLRYGTRSENMRDRVLHGTHSNARKTHCPRGHAYDEANTYFVRTRPTSRYCRACANGRRAAA